MAQPFGIIDDVFSVHSLTLFHHRTDHINLMTFLHLFFDKAVSLVPVIRVHNTIFYWQSLRRQFIDD